MSISYELKLTKSRYIDGKLSFENMTIFKNTKIGDQYQPREIVFSRPLTEKEKKTKFSKLCDQLEKQYSNFLKN